MLITLSEVAKAVGCAVPTVSKAVARGRLDGAVVMRGHRRLFDRDLAVELWERNRMAPGRPRVAKEPEPEPPSTPEELERKIQGIPDDQIPELGDSRRRREHYLAELAKLQVEKEREALVSAEDVKKRAYALGKVIREALINIPDRVAHQIAAESDATVIHALLTAEIVQALEGLSNGV